MERSFNLKTATLLVIALVGGAFIAGCGSGSETKVASSTTSTGQATSPPVVTTTAATIPTAPATTHPTKTTPAPSTSATSTPRAATAPTTPTTRATPTTTQTTASTPAPVTTHPANSKFSAPQAVKLCKLLVQGQPTLAQSAKASLEKTCAKAAGGNEAAFRKVAYKVCVEIVNFSHVPAGSAREQALAACKAQ